MLVIFFCYISFIGFVNVKGKGLVRLREAIKKNYQTLDIVQTWKGGSAAQPNPGLSTSNSGWGGDRFPRIGGYLRGGTRVLWGAD